MNVLIFFIFIFILNKFQIINKYNKKLYIFFIYIYLNVKNFYVGIKYLFPLFIFLIYINKVIFIILFNKKIINIHLYNRLIFNRIIIIKFEKI